MRPIAAVCASAVLLLASGCMGGDGAPQDAVDAPQAPAGNATAPSPMVWEGTITFAADVTNVATGAPCGPLNACDMRSFSTNATLDLVATLSWGSPANDLDLYLFEDEEEVSRDGINQVGDPPATTQVLVHAGLPPGDYTFWVVPWNAAMEDYRLEAVFS